MSTEMNWSHDFCLYCDKQTTDGAYCSQTCRVADLEKSEPASPMAFNTHSTHASWQYQSQTQTYSLYRTSSSTRLESSPTTPRTLNSQSGYFAAVSTMSSYTQNPKRLSTSSSRSSLSSVGSGANATTNSQGLNDQAYTQLRDYANSFDQTRDWKRRQTLS